MWLNRRLAFRYTLKEKVPLRSGAMVASSNTVLNSVLYKIESYVFSFSELSSLLLDSNIDYYSLNSLTQQS
jgi:hypothetical protein